METVTVPPGRKRNTSFRPPSDGETFLAKDYLLGRIGALNTLLMAHASAADARLLAKATNDMQAFVEARFAAVSAQLALP